MEKSNIRRLELIIPCPKKVIPFLHNIKNLEELVIRSLYKLNCDNFVEICFSDCQQLLKLEVKQFDYIVKWEYDVKSLKYEMHKTFGKFAYMCWPSYIYLTIYIYSTIYS